MRAVSHSYQSWRFLSEGCLSDERRDIPTLCVLGNIRGRQNKIKTGYFRNRIRGDLISLRFLSCVNWNWTLCMSTVFADVESRHEYVPPNHPVNNNKMQGI